MPISLSIIVPALNEARNIEAAIAGIVHSLDESGIIDAEILVMTCLDRNGQHDGTVDIVKRLSEADQRIRSIHENGYQKLGEKFRNAVRLAAKEYVIMIPGDNENDPSSFPEIFRQIGKADMVVSYTSNPEVRSLYRRFLSRTYTLALNLFFWHGMPYYNGINVYRTADLREALPETDSFAYAAEILVKLLNKKHSYVVVPIRIQPRVGETKALGWNSFRSVIAAILRLRARLGRE
ncbi:glycosyltransferase family 2 protein [Patescibacteria group bacterium]|nr:glycosyltransferase family 2 protein [Patescibacteria group bacterium]MBU1907801.1 glycosyltransferase family 2 protein [Patescibacteria group bacterium]